MASFILVTRIVKKKKRKENEKDEIPLESNRIGCTMNCLSVFLKGKILHNDVGGIKKE